MACVHNLMPFITYVDSCCNLCNQDTELFHHHKAFYAFIFIQNVLLHLKCIFVLLRSRESIFLISNFLITIYFNQVIHLTLIRNFAILALHDDQRQIFQS